MRIITIVALCLIGTAASAQQGAPPPDYNAQALGQKLMQEVNAELQAQAALLEAQARIKRLEADLAAARQPAPAEAPK